MHKKSQGLSMNMIVVAAIVIIVLIVVIAIFSGKMTFFQKGVRSCTSQGGKCSCWSGTSDNPQWGTTCGNNDEDCPEGWAPVEGTDCTTDDNKNNDICCVKVL